MPEDFTVPTPLQQATLPELVRELERRCPNFVFAYYAPNEMLVNRACVPLMMHHGDVYACFGLANAAAKRLEDLTKFTRQ